MNLIDRGYGDDEAKKLWKKLKKKIPGSILRQIHLSISSLILPSYPQRATI